MAGGGCLGRCTWCRRFGGLRIGITRGWRGDALGGSWRARLNELGRGSVRDAGRVLACKLARARGVDEFNKKSERKSELAKRSLRGNWNALKRTGKGSSRYALRVLACWVAVARRAFSSGPEGAGVLGDTGTTGVDEFNKKSERKSELAKRSLRGNWDALKRAGKGSSRYALRVLACWVAVARRA